MARSPALAAPTSNTSAVVRFAMIGVVTVLGVGMLLVLVWGSAPEKRAIIISACIALPLQVLTFAGVRSVAREHVMSAWAGGTLLRFAALAIYGFFVVKALGLPSSAALVSFAAFLFALTLIEPLLLNKS